MLQMAKNDKNKYQSIYNKFKNHKKTEGFELENISEIFIPFWYCKQQIVVEKDVEIDRFSKIILELINSEITSHTEICDFLGIKETDFTTMQFHYLLKNELVEENYKNGNAIYEITHKGISFLKGKSKVHNIETVEFEYFYNDLSMEMLDVVDYKYLYNDLSKEYFNPREPLDKDTSKNKSKAFSGYQVVQTHKLKNSKIKQLAHKNRPSLNKIKHSDFASFFNNQKSDMSFYDFENKDIELHKRSILFLQLEYKNDEYQTEYEIRQFKSSVNEFKGNVLEEKLSLDLTKHYKD